MRHSHTLTALLAFVLCASLSQLADSQTRQAQAAPMTNAEVLSLTTAGIAPDIIISRIRSAPQKSFDTSVDALKSLKAAGVSGDVIVVMVNGGAPLILDTTLTASGFKEPVFKEGLWEQRTTTVSGPGIPVFPYKHSSCHSHASDHLQFEKLKNGDAPNGQCKIIGVTVEDEKQVLNIRCSGQGTVSSMKLSFSFSDEDHARSTMTIVYNPPVHGISTASTTSEMTFKGPCPPDLRPGEDSLSRGRLNLKQPH